MNHRFANLLSFSSANWKNRVCYVIQFTTHCVAAPLRSLREKLASH